MTQPLPTIPLPGDCPIRRPFVDALKLAYAQARAQYEAAKLVTAEMGLEKPPFLDYLVLNVFGDGSEGGPVEPPQVPLAGMLSGALFARELQASLLALPGTALILQLSEVDHENQRCEMRVVHGIPEACLAEFTANTTEVLGPGDIGAAQTLADSPVDETGSAN